MSEGYTRVCACHLTPLVWRWARNSGSGLREEPRCARTDAPLSRWLVVDALSRDVVGAGYLDQPGVLLTGFFEGESGMVQAGGRP